jgi:hypothetical protein
MTRETTIEVALLLDLGPHAPDGPGLVGLARALALELQAAAEDVAAKATEASGPEEVDATRPRVDYRVGGGHWQDLSKEES